jgi:hypothetical protein
VRSDIRSNVFFDRCRLFDDVGDRFLLTLVERADHRRKEHSEGERIEHGGRVYTTDPISGLKDPRPGNETLRHRSSSE